MSAAANAAGYLYFHGTRPTSGFNDQVRHPDPEPKEGVSVLHTVLHTAKPTRTAKIEYRRRRYYPLPSAA